MRMERINEHQVRCVITAKDLEEHQLTPGDLKYGTKEIRALFNEVIGQAVEDYRFNEDHYPVMIEAIPMQGGELLVILSAVDNIEELDPHFAHFQEDVEDEEEETQEETGFREGDAFAEKGVALFSLPGMGDVMRFCHRLSGLEAHTELFRGKEPHTFYLAVLRPEGMDQMEFFAFQNSVAEYAEPVNRGNALYEWLKEHGELLLLEPHRVLSKK